MQIRLVAKDFSISPSLRDHLERRLNSDFAPVQNRIANVAIRLRDLNGPHGGRDKLCQVSVTMPGQPRVIVEDVQENVYTAIDQAVSRAAYRVTRLAHRRSAVRRSADVSSDTSSSAACPEE